MMASGAGERREKRPDIRAHLSGPLLLMNGIAFDGHSRLLSHSRIWLVPEV
jgi:hypothetical protein